MYFIWRQSNLEYNQAGSPPNVFRGVQQATGIQNKHVKNRFIFLRNNCCGNLISNSIQYL